MDFNYTKIAEMLASLKIIIRHECFTIKVDFINICRFPCGGGFDYHMHSNFEFHYIKQGKGTLVLNGMEYNLGPGDFYITGPGNVHKQTADDIDPMVEYALQCDIDLDLSESQKNQHSVEEYHLIYDIIKSKTTTVVKDRNQLDRIFENLFMEAHDKRIGYFIEMKHIILQLIIASVRNFDKGDTVVYKVPQRDINSHRVSIVKGYIIDNPCKNITCQDLASHLFLSPRQLNRIILDNTGYSVHEFVMMYKIEKIKDILKNSDFKLNEIAKQTGFSSEFHLSNTFKKWVGVSPAKYRDMEKAK